MPYFERTKTSKEIEKRYRELYPLVTGVKPVPEQPEDKGYIKPGGWGGDMSNPSKWKVTKMKDDPKQWKVVDAKGKNIAANFLTKEGAQAFIAKGGGGTAPPPGPAPQPEDIGFVKPGGWGGDTKSPTHWKVTAMKDDPKLFKIVDKKGKNIATNFVTKEGAQAFINAAIQLQGQDGDTPDLPDEVPDTPEPVPIPGTAGDAPYKGIGTEMTSERRPKGTGYTTRHYASGKDDDRTMEHNVKNIKFKNYQFLVDVKVTTIEHDDTVSLKYGGTHMGSGWFDNTVRFESGQVGLGTEEEHPDADLEIIKGIKVGSILNKKIRLAGVYFTDQNKCEMWIDTGAGWKKGAEGTNVGGFNPGSSSDEAQLRIDGFDAVPQVTRAVVQEIA